MSVEFLGMAGRVITLLAIPTRTVFPNIVDLKVKKRRRLTLASSFGKASFRKTHRSWIIFSALASILQPISQAELFRNARLLLQSGARACRPFPESSHYGS